MVLFCYYDSKPTLNYNNASLTNSYKALKKVKPICFLF